MAPPDVGAVVEAGGGQRRAYRVGDRPHAARIARHAMVTRATWLPDVAFVGVSLGLPSAWPRSGAAAFRPPGRATDGRVRAAPQGSRLVLTKGEGRPMVAEKCNNL
ncbi:hypothetical protein GCM10027074_16900 [Streptomyces deserti]